MMKYTYKDKETGKKVYSDKPLKDKKLVLVTAIRDGQMKANKIQQKRHGHPTN